MSSSRISSGARSPRSKRARRGGRSRRAGRVRREAAVVLEAGGDHRHATSSLMRSSMTAPKMMLASGSAAFWMISAASLTSNRPRSRPPVMLSRMPVAPSIDSSSSGEEIAALGGVGGAVLAGAGADAHQRRAGVAHDRAHVGEVEVDQAGDGDQVGDALDALAQDVVGLAEGVEDRGAPLDDREQPLVGDHDQRVDVLAELLDALLGLARALRPSKSNGRVTTPTVSAPISLLAISAMTGAAPVPVPPPSPAVTNTMSAPLSASLISSRDSAAAPKPTSGLAPAPRPLVELVADVAA